MYVHTRWSPCCVIAEPHKHSTSVSRHRAKDSCFNLERVPRPPNGRSISIAYQQSDRQDAMRLAKGPADMYVIFRHVGTCIYCADAIPYYYSTRRSALGTPGL